MSNEKEMPEWAKKIENWGENFWEKSENKKSPKKKSNIAGYIAAIVVNAALIFVFNNLLNWNTPWLTTEFSIPLWIFNISFVSLIVFNLLYIAYDAGWFLAITRMATNLISIAAIATVIEIFPFQLTENHVHVAKMILFVALIGTMLAVIVELVKLLVYILRFIFVRK